MLLVVPVSRQANRPTLHTLGCQTRIGQYQTDKGDILLGHDGGSFRGVWVVRLLGSDLDVITHPGFLPQPVTRRIRLRLVVLRGRFRYLCRFGAGSFGLFGAGFGG